MSIYPNPVKDYTNISFTLKEDGYARIELFNNIGRKMDMVHLNNLYAGFHNYHYYPYPELKGLYLLRITVNDVIYDAKRMYIE